MEVHMQVAKWGNSLAVRIPAAVADALALKEGDDVEIHVAGDRVFELGKTPTLEERLVRLRRLRRPMPEGFHFDRTEANERR
jgi:antitoxin MazE